MNKFYNKITKFLSTQILLTFVAFFIVLSLIIFGNQFYLVFSRTLNDLYFGSELFLLILLKYLRDIPFIVSLSFSLAILYALNKLYKSSELVVLANSGFGDFRIFKILLPLIATTAFFVFYLTSFFVPQVNEKIELLKSKESSRPDYIFLKEEVFQKFKNQNATIYVSNVDSNSENQILKNIFLFLDKGNKVILANNGKKFLDEKTGKIFLTLFNGKIYQNLVTNDINNFSVSNFENFEILLYEPSLTDENKHIDSKESMNIVELINDGNNSLREILYRFSVPISILIMSILSIQFSRVSPRNPRSYELGYGLLIYIAYYNLLIYVREIKISNYNDLMFIFTLPHIPFLILVFVIFIFRNHLTLRN